MTTDPATDPARGPLEAAHRTLLEVRRTRPVYGLTTGVGGLRHVDLDVGEPAPGTDGPALRLWRSHAAGSGPELDDATARATMAVRLRQLRAVAHGRGGSGVSPGLVDALAAAVASGAVPRLASYGGIGTADLTVLAQLALTLVGERPWRSLPPGVAAPPPAAVVDGDALPFLSSNASTLALAGDATARLRAWTGVVEEVVALSFLALRGNGEAYDARVHAARPWPVQEQVATRLRTLLGAAADGSGQPVTGPGVRIQDPFSLRTVPQVHAPWLEALDRAAEVVAADVDAPLENPLVVDGTVLHHGQFVTQRLTAALDGVRLSLYPVLALVTARTSALMDPGLTGVRAFVADGPPGSSGLMILEYVSRDVLARALSLCQPDVGVVPVISLGLEEYASFSTQAALACRAVADLLPDLLAPELVAALGVLRADPARVPATPCPALALLDAADAALPRAAADRVLGPELHAAADLLRARAGVGPAGVGPAGVGPTGVGPAGATGSPA